MIAGLVASYLGDVLATDQQRQSRLAVYSVAASCVAVGTKPSEVLAIARQFAGWVCSDPVRLSILSTLAASYRLDSGRPVRTRAREMLDDAAAVLAFVEGGEA